MEKYPSAAFMHVAISFLIICLNSTVSPLRVQAVYVNVDASTTLQYSLAPLGIRMVLFILHDFTSACSTFFV